MVFFSNNLSLESREGDQLEFDTHVYNINLNCVHDSFDVCFRCYGNLKFPLSYNGKSGNNHLLLCSCIYIYNLFTQLF